MCCLGELVGLVGPSGSAPSRCCHAVGLLESAPNTRLIIDGQDFAAASDAERTRMRLAKIGFVYQFHHLLPEYTALGNVALPQRILGVSAWLSPMPGRAICWWRWGLE